MLRYVVVPQLRAVTKAVIFILMQRYIIAGLTLCAGEE